MQSRPGLSLFSSMQVQCSNYQVHTGARLILRRAYFTIITTLLPSGADVRIYRGMQGLNLKTNMIYELRTAWYSLVNAYVNEANR